MESEWYSIVKDIAVPLGILLLGWIKASQTKHGSEVRETLKEIGKELSGLHTRVAVLEDRGRRSPSYMSMGRTKDVAEDNGSN